MFGLMTRAAHEAAMKAKDATIAGLNRRAAVLADDLKDVTAAWLEQRDLAVKRAGERDALLAQRAKSLAPLQAHNAKRKAEAAAKKAAKVNGAQPGA